MYIELDEIEFPKADTVLSLIIADLLDLLLVFFLDVQRNFMIADYLLYQNGFSRDVFLDDYMIREFYQGKIMLSGYPRNSAFFASVAISIWKIFPATSSPCFDSKSTWFSDTGSFK